MGDVWVMGDTVTFKDAQAVLADISYKPGWEFELEIRLDTGKECWFLRLSCPVIDALDGVTPRRAYGRWWEIPYKTRGDVARTAFMACLVMEEHECREGFRYKGKAIYGPHFDIDVLADIAEKTEQQPDFQTDFLE